NNLFQSSTFVSDAFRLSPNAPELYDENGKLNWENSTWNNPFSELNRTQEINTNTLNVSAAVSYAIFDGLNLKLNSGYTKTDSKNLSKRPISAFDPASQVDSNSNEADHSETNRNSWIVEPQLTYAKTLSKANFDMVFGATLQKSNSDYLQLRSRGYTQERF